MRSADESNEGLNGSVGKFLAKTLAEMGVPAASDGLVTLRQLPDRQPRFAAVGTGDPTAAPSDDFGSFVDDEGWYFDLIGGDLGLWDWDMHSNLNYMSARCIEMLGFYTDDQSDQSDQLFNWVERMHPDDLLGAGTALAEHLLGRSEQYRVEMRIRTRIGDYKWIESRGRVIERDASGTPTRMIGTHADIDSRKKFEARLHEQAMLVEKAHDSIFVLDLDDRITLWNRSAEILYRVSVEQALGQPVGAVLRVEGDALATALAYTRDKGEWAGELAIDVGLKNPVVGDCRLTLVRDESGDPRSILAITTNITKRKAVEDQLFRAQRMESIGTLAAGVAHDLNNMLAPILLYCDMLASTHTDDGPTQERISGIETSTRRASGLVSQLLSLARGTVGNRLPIRVSQLIAETSRLADATFDRSIEISTETPGDLWSVEGDPTQLHQVLVNLCVNARDSMADGGMLTLSARNETAAEDGVRRPPGIDAKEFCVIEVSDTGHGMSPDVLAQIFDPFYSTKEIGTGIGLSLVESIVHGHGGFLDVRTAPGEGSSFLVYLPADSDVSAEPSGSNAIGEFDGRGQVVLIVEDEEPVRVVLPQVLEDHGYKVLVAQNGTEALDALGSSPDQIGSVLIDMQMPGISGAELIQTVRERYPGLLVVGTSAVASSEVEAKARVAGANRFLAKPYKTVDLLRTLAGAAVSGPSVD